MENNTHYRLAKKLEKHRLRNRVLRICKLSGEKVTGGWEKN
jgi:hypothetical protein